MDFDGFTINDVDITKVKLERLKKKDWKDLLTPNMSAKFDLENTLQILPFFDLTPVVFSDVIVTPIN